VPFFGLRLIIAFRRRQQLHGGSVHCPGILLWPKRDDGSASTKSGFLPGSFERRFLRTNKKPSAVSQSKI
jgi:hypothetical protein